MRTIGASLRGLIAAAALLSGASDAGAVVGTTIAADPLRSHLVMVLKRSGVESGFCSGVVIASRTVLTAGHCVADATELSVFVPGSAGPLAIDASAVDPLYRADAIQTRQRSIDLALVHLAEPLPVGASPAPLGALGRLPIGAEVRLAGFGVAVEGDGTSAGRLRAKLMQVRAPLSVILLWLDSADGQSGGACEGDSGGGVFEAASDTLVGITDWAEGDGSAQCGSLTQAALLAPQRGWIGSVLRKWRNP